MIKWKKGMRVKKIFSGSGGYTEESEGTITAVSKARDLVIFNDEHGTTYDLRGKEKENFFAGMSSRIEPLK